MRHNGRPLVVASRKLQAKPEFRLFRFGDNPSSKGTYKLTPESADRLMSLYARRGLRVTFDFDHAALKSDARPGDGKAAGNCDLELRDDGIWCTDVRWTPSTQKAVEEGEWLYFSPAFLPNEETHEIEELVNVALTNIPAMDNIEPIAANRNNSERRAVTMNKKMSEHLKKFVSGGGKLEDCSKGTGIHIDRMKQLHDGDAPSSEEMSALAKHFKFGPEQMKEIQGEESDVHTGDGPTAFSAIDGQDADNFGGDDDDKVEHEDLRGEEPNMLRRHTNDRTLRMLTMLTGTADPKKQEARLKAMAVRAQQHEEDHAEIVRMKAERETEKRNRLIEKAKTSGQLTPKLLKWAMTQDVDALEEFLKYAPVALNMRGTVEVDPEHTAAAETLSREELEVAKYCGIDAEEMVAAKKIMEADPQAEIKKQRAAVMKLYKKQDAEQVLGIIAERKLKGVVSR